jgi:hypothetical protein
MVRRPRPAKSAGMKTARTFVKKARRPKTSGGTQAAAAAAAAGPSDEELDLRDRLKAGPRRPAGPPLSEAMPTPEAMRALAEEVLPEPTDPKKG